MSLCTRNRWGTGSCSTTKTETIAQKEMNEKFKKLMDERNKLDTIWINQTTLSTSSDVSSKVVDNKLRG